MNDDITGGQLDTQGVLDARKQELAWIHRAEVYNAMREQESPNHAGVD